MCNMRRAGWIKQDLGRNGGASHRNAMEFGHREEGPPVLFVTIPRGGTNLPLAAVSGKLCQPGATG